MSLDIGMSGLDDIDPRRGVEAPNVVMSGDDPPGTNPPAPFDNVLYHPIEGVIAVDVDEIEIVATEPFDNIEGEPLDNAAAPTIGRQTLD
jgi:hypothetical protein